MLSLWAKWLWPYMGYLAALMNGGRDVVVETYPRESTGASSQARRRLSIDKEYGWTWRGRSGAQPACAYS